MKDLEKPYEIHEFSRKSDKFVLVKSGESGENEKKSGE